MKKQIIYLMVFCMSVSATLYADNKETVTLSQLNASVKSCPELDRTLTQKFGKEYALIDQKVQSELKKFAESEIKSDCKCKISVYVLKNLSTNLIK